MKRLFAIIFLAMGILVALTFPNLHKPFSPDELHWQVASERLKEAGRFQQFVHHKDIINSPHAYPWLLTVFQHLPFNTLANSRLLGLLCISATLILGVMTTRNPWVFALLALACPPLVQGSLIVEIDNTLLVPLLLALALSMHRYEHDPSNKSFVLLALAVAVALWAKITTPLVLLGIWMGLLALKGRRLPMIPVGIGILVFTVTWWGYCRHFGYNPMEPLTYVVESVRHKTSLGVMGPLKNILETLLWFGPGVIWLFHQCFFQDVGAQPAAPKTVWALALTFLGYFVVGGCVFGLPRYQIPLFVCLAWWVSNVESGEAPHPALPPRGGGLQMTVAVVLSAMMVALAGDPILAWRHDLKWHLLTGEGSFLKMGMAWSVPWLILPLLLWALCRRWKARAGTWILVWALGYGLGLGALQAAGGYQTGYSYGLRGMTGLTQILEGKRSIATHDVIYALNQEGSINRAPTSNYKNSGVTGNGFVDEEIYDRPLEILRQLEHGEADALTLSPAVNTLAQIQGILACAALADYLGVAFERQRIGSFWVWTRRH